MSIASTAIISDKAILGENNTIGPYVIIEKGVRIGSHNSIGPHAVLLEGTTIGDYNEIHAGAVIGGFPQDVKFDHKSSYVHIGNRNRIREYATINRATGEDNVTIVGDDNFLMCQSHVGHNAVVGNKVIMVNSSGLGGYAIIEDGAVLSAAAYVHQFTRVGKGSLIGGVSAAIRDVPPFIKVVGMPAMVNGLNVVGLRRSGVTAAVRAELKRAYKIMFRSGLSVRTAIAEISSFAQSDEVKYFITFIEASKRGIVTKQITQKVFRSGARVKMA